MDVLAVSVSSPTGPAHHEGMRPFDTAGVEARLNRRLVVAAGVLIGVGSLLGFAGMAVGSGAILAASRRWLRHKDVHPRDLAAQAWRRTTEASRAGAQAWRATAPAASR